MLRQGHTVYVHCNMGINRSPSIVIAYLHWVQGWDLEKATDHVLKCRSCDPYVDAIGLAGEDRERNGFKTVMPEAPLVSGALLIYKPREI